MEMMRWVCEKMCETYSSEILVTSVESDEVSSSSGMVPMRRVSFCCLSVVEEGRVKIVTSDSSDMLERLTVVWEGTMELSDEQLDILVCVW